MAETRRGPLAEGVERFDRLVRIVKDSQLGRTAPKQSAGESFVLSPEDAWAKKYTTRCIGPVCYTVEAEAPVFAKFGTPETPVKALPARPGPSPRQAAGEPIGLLIGKPVRRRSWLGRLFGR